MRPLLVFLSLLIVPISTHARPTPLNDGYLGTRGSQIVDSRGQPVRIAAITWNGADGRTKVPQGLDSVSLRHTVRQMAAAGFNTVRIPFSGRILSEYPAEDAVDGLRNPDLVGLTALQVLDKIIRAAGAAGLRVILDRHDTGRAMSGTLQADWVALAQRYANNPTVIGFDLANEPIVGPNSRGVPWGEGGPTDPRAICMNVGAAIQTVNPDVLIICEGNQDQASAYPEGDLRGVAARPVVLPVPNKVVYSVHEFPAETSGVTPVSKTAAIERMNRAWGYLITEDIAPVFVGEMGSSLLTAESRSWASTMVAYLNGTAPDGIRLARWQVPVSAGWWAWGDLTGEVPRGVLRGGWEPWMNKFRPEQQAVWSQLLFDAPAKPIESAIR